MNGPSFSRRTRPGPASRLRKTVVKLLLLPGIVAVAPASAETPISEFGARVGVSDGGSSEDFTLYEVFARRALPWGWALTDQWRLDTYLEAGLGLLEAAGDEGSVVSLGPVAVVNREGSPWRFELGIKPTWLSDDSYGREDLGGEVHFTSHLALNYRFRRGPQIGYRFQHTSNADLDDLNPGLDMHLLAVTWLLE